MTKTSRKIASRRILSISVTSVLVTVVLSGCYSFRGGSAPPHLESIYIDQVEDNSGSGRANLAFDLTNMLIDRFREDNSLRVIDDREADSRLETGISALQTDIRRAVSEDDRETVRGVVVTVNVTFFDNVKSRNVYENKSFRGESSYDVSEGATGEIEAINDALENVVDQVLIATVADW